MATLPRLALVGIFFAAQSGATAHQNPADRASAIAFTNHAAGTGWLKFELPDYRRVVVSGRINGTPAHLLLDSGVGGLVLDREFAGALGVSDAGSVTGIGVTGIVAGRLTAGVAISIDNLTIDAPQAEVYDLKPLAAVSNEPIAALLGRDLFDRLIVDIDFAHTRMAFWDPHVKRSLPGGYDIALREDRYGLRGLPVSIESHAPIEATLDFGSDRALSVSPDYASSQGLLADRKSSTTLSAGAAGITVGEVAVIKTLAIGPAIFHDVPVEVPRTWSFANPVIVGMPIIRRMRLLVDFPHDRIVARADPPAFLQPFRKDRSGIGARRLADRLQIMHVAARSPAESIGLRAGDEIIAIDGQPMNGDYFRRYPRVGSQPAGTAMVLTLANHAQLTLTLADYY